jgi:hypothetical protein
LELDNVSQKESNFLAKLSSSLFVMENRVFKDSSTIQLSFFVSIEKKIFDILSSCFIPVFAGYNPSRKTSKYVIVMSSFGLEIE